MLQDPNAGYGSNPENPYNVPPPQNPYGVPPPQDPYSAPPPQYPYNVPPTPYGAPPVTSYGSQQGYGYGYTMPPSAPPPLGEALQQWPSQCVKVLTKPSVQTFAEEMWKASWGIIWVQLLVYAIIVAILGYLGALISPETFSNVSGSSFSSQAIRGMILFVAIGLLIFIPLGTFIGEGITYLIARAFGGTGSFMQQMYVGLLYSVPIAIVSSLIGLIPILGGLVGFALLIYAIVLRIFSLMAVHRLSGGKATAVVLIPVAILFVLACAMIFVAVFLVAAAYQR